MAVVAFQRPSARPHAPTVRRMNLRHAEKLLAHLEYAHGHEPARWCGAEELMNLVGTRSPGSLQVYLYHARNLLWQQSTREIEVQYGTGWRIKASRPVSPGSSA